MRSARSRDQWPGSPDLAVQWLNARGGSADDEIDQLHHFLDVVLIARALGVFDSFLWRQLLLPLLDMRALRRARTNRDRIGSLSADQARVFDYERVWRPLRFRLTLIAVVVLGGVAADAGPIQTVLLALMVPFIGAHTVIGVLFAAIAVAFGQDTWWYCVFCLLAVVNVVHAMSLRELFGRIWDDRGPFLGFLPLRVVAILFVRRKLSMVATLVDLSEADNSDLVSVFADACADVPAVVAPVVDLCRATAALHDGELDQAIAIAARARAAAVSAPASIRGWCALQVGAILLSSGRDDDTRAALAEAANLLRGRRPRRWRRRAELWLLELDVGREDRADLVDLLRRIHRLRFAATRLHDSDLVCRTELWLARLALVHGTGDGVRWTVDHIVGPADGRGDIVQTREETAAGLILRATAHLGNPDATKQVHADAVAALALVDAARRPLAAVNARLVLARLCESEGRLDEAMAHAAEALVVANRARYQLPSSRWRAQWSVRQLDVFATALRLAGLVGDSAFVAEIVELARGEVLPARSSVAEVGLLSILDLFGERRVVGPPEAGVTAEDADVAFAIAGFSPVTRPPVARIAGERMLTVDEPGVEIFDLDRELVATAGRCWYWSGVTVADRYYWAVRSPEGRWSHGWVDQRPGSPATRALAALDAALPVAQTGEASEQVLARVLDGPLGRPTCPAKEVELLAAVSAAFLPVTLARGLLDEQPAGRKLVVSLPATLSRIPVAWLPLSLNPEVRVVERVAVMYVPAWAILTRCRARPRGGVRAQWPVRLALINPSDSADIKVMREPPPLARIATAKPMSKPDLGNALTALSDSRDWLLYLIGHMASEPGNSSLHGLELAGDQLDGLLTLRDLVATDQEGSARYPVPARVLAVGCDSMGMSSAVERHHDRALANEWLGFSAAVMLAGADHVCCTAYTVFENKALLAIAHTLAESLAREPDACLAVAEVQRKLLRRWRTTRRGLPVLRQSFVYVGRG